MILPFPSAAPGRRPAGRLLDRLTGPAPAHPRFAGPPPDLSVLDADELGEVWAQAQVVFLQGLGRPLHQLRVAQAIDRQARASGRRPRLDAGACRVLFGAIADDLDAGRGAVDASRRVDRWQRAIEHLECLAGDPPPALAGLLRRILGEPAGWALRPATTHAFAATVDWIGAHDGTAAEPLLAAWRAAVLPALAPLALLQDEARALDGLRRDSRLALAGAFAGTHVPAHDTEGDAAECLVDDDAYVAFARSALAGADARIVAIQAGAGARRRDAFAPAECALLARAARVALLRGEAALAVLVERLFARSCQAPPMARALPLQTLAVALARALAALETPAGDAVLAAGLAPVRHAGMRRRLLRERSRPQDRPGRRIPQTDD